MTTYHGGWVAMTLVMLLVWAGLAAALWWAVRGPRPRPPAAPDAEQLLTARFARGEIDADEFLRSRELILGRR